MKSDLEILIEHFQNEIDELKSSMDECISEYDFKGAEAFKTPFFYTKRKLRVLKNLQNPNFDKISKLKGMISRMQNGLDSKIFSFECFDKKMVDRIEQHFRKSRNDTIDKWKTELKELKAVNPESRIDSDQLLELLYELNTSSLERIEILLIENKISLELKRKGTEVTMKLIPINNIKIDNYLSKSNKSILKELGFDDKCYAKIFVDYRQIDKFVVLKEMSIVVFEVFSLTGNLDMNIVISKT